MRILVVEDDPHIAAFVQQGLCEREGVVEVFVGTDDEDWGGVLRRLPVGAGAE